MSAAMQQLKTAMRAEFRAKIAALSREARTRAAGDLCGRVQGSEIWRAAEKVLLFAPMADEPDIWPLLEIGLAEGKQVALPQFSATDRQYVAACIRDLKNDVRAGQFRIREPAESCAPVRLSEINLALAPALAFDVRGFRLGRGRGFYDRLLEKISGVKCGVAFDEQIVTEIPLEAHDERVDWLVTPTRLLKTERTR